MTTRQPLAIALAGSLSLLLTACPGSAPTTPGATGGDTVKIGFIAPITGADAAIGEGSLNGVRLAIEGINAAGGVNGKKLEVIVKDDLGTASKGVEVAKDLVARGVVAIVGPNWSGVTKQVVLEVTKAAGIPNVSPGATSPTLATFDDGGYFFRTIPNDLLQGKALSKTMQEDNHRQITVLCRSNDYGNGLADALIADFNATTGNLATKFAYPDDDKQDYPTIKAKFGAGSSAVALIGYTSDGASIVKDWIASKQDGAFKWYFSESLRENSFAANVNNNALLEGMKGTFPSASGTYLSTFTTSYKAKFGKDPAAYDANAYDATMLIALAMAQGKANTGAAIKANLIEVSRGGTKQSGIGKDGFTDALAKLKAGTDLDYDGVVGSVDMADNGELTGGTYVIWQWVNGQHTETAKKYSF